MARRDAPLSAAHVLEYAYVRSVGSVIGRFFGALRDRTVLGAKTATGRVIVPPTEYDPDTGDDIVDLVEVSDAGRVVTWSWVDVPRTGQPLDRPFGWALIQLDGADTAMLHAVDAGSAAAMRTGMRVRVRWATEPRGDIHDIACFEPTDAR